MNDGQLWTPRQEQGDLDGRLARIEGVLGLMPIHKTLPPFPTSFSGALTYTQTDRTAISNISSAVGPLLSYLNANRF